MKVAQAQANAVDKSLDVCIAVRVQRDHKELNHSDAFATTAVKSEPQRDNANQHAATRGGAALVAQADAVHFSDMRVEPTFEDSTIGPSPSRFRASA